MIWFNKKERCNTSFANAIKGLLKSQTEDGVSAVGHERSQDNISVFHAFILCDIL